MKMKKAIIIASVYLLLTSCSTQDFIDLATSSLEYNMEKGLESMGRKNGSKISPKQAVKEQEKLKQEGKCPTCRGMGKSIDGKYDCPTCKGTGKYQQ